PRRTKSGGSRSAWCAYRTRGFSPLPWSGTSHEWTAGRWRRGSWDTASTEGLVGTRARRHRPFLARDADRGGVVPPYDRPPHRAEPLVDLLLTAADAPPIRTSRSTVQPPLAEPAVDDDGDLGVAGELALQVLAQLGAVAGDDEDQLGHGT